MWTLMTTWTSDCHHAPAMQAEPFPPCGCLGFTVVLTVTMPSWCSADGFLASVQQHHAA